MKIDFSKEEYRALMDMIEIADWVLHAQYDEQPAGTKRYSALRKKILSHAEEMGFGHLVEYDPGKDEYFETREYEERGGWLEHVEAFEDDAFWHLLASSLAMRDLAEQEGEEALARMPEADLADRRAVLESWYYDEFSENGIENVRVVSTRRRAAELTH